MKRYLGVDLHRTQWWRQGQHRSGRKFLEVIYHTLKNHWVFEDFPNFVLAS